MARRVSQQDATRSQAQDAPRRTAKDHPPEGLEVGGRATSQHQEVHVQFTSDLHQFVGRYPSSHMHLNGGVLDPQMLKEHTSPRQGPPGLTALAVRRGEKGE
jgi:hypothetical protein